MPVRLVRDRVPLTGRTSDSGGQRGRGSVRVVLTPGGLRGALPHSYWYGEMPPGSHAVTEPEEMAYADFATMPSSARTSSIGGRRRRTSRGAADPDRRHARRTTRLAASHPRGARPCPRATDGRGRTGTVPCRSPRTRSRTGPTIIASKRERTRIVVGAGDEPEHLDLALDRRAVVGQHVHPVVLGEERRRAPGPPGK